MQVDHIAPVFHNMTESKANGIGRSKGHECLTNYMPSCRRCNFRKSDFSLENFRSQINDIKARLLRDAPNYRMALDYGLIQELSRPVVFYFETLSYVENAERLTKDSKADDSEDEKIMKNKKQITDKIEEIRKNQKGLLRQGRIEEANYWNESLRQLEWVLNENF